MTIKTERYFPVGYDPETEIRWTRNGLIGSACLSLLFPLRYFEALENCLFIEENGSPFEQYMRSFSFCTEYCFTGFLITALCLLLLIPWHYAYHRRGSQSIYLMRRLPDRWELARRCAAFPLAGVGVCALCAALLWLIYAAIYVFATPARFMHPVYEGQIWRAVFGV